VSDFYPLPVKLSDEHEVSHFRCGSHTLDDWLKQYALINQRAGMATTYVASERESARVVGYYALSAGAVARSEAPRRVAQGVPNHPIPVMLLARLAVDENHQGKRLGRGLLRDALIRVNAAADEVGVRALLIHAKDEEARDFYLSQAEFEPSPLDSLQLFLLMKDLRRAVAV
jgi:GNAT superfamily N-acetyltransferase